MLRTPIIIGIILIFILTSFGPMVIGYDYHDTSQDVLMDDIAFYCYDKFGSNMEELYREYLERQIESNDITSTEPVIPIFNPVPSIIDGDPMNSPWPMKCHDLHHTGQSPYSLINNPLVEIWRFKSSKWIESGIIIDNEGLIYFGDWGWYLYSIYPNGDLNWKVKLNGEIISTPAIDNEGTIYVGTFGNTFYAINRDGSEKWHISVGGSIASSPAIDNDGTIYFGTLRGFDKGDIIALNSNGTLKWKYETGYYITSDPAISDDGTLYIGSGDGNLYAMNPNGTLRWCYKTNNYIKGPPSIADDGTIYFGSYDGYLYATYPNGTFKWKCKVGTSGTETNPSIANDGTIYVGDDKLYAINSDGTNKWSFDIGSNSDIHMSSPAITDDGKVFVGILIGADQGGEVIAVNPDGTEYWRSGKIANICIESSPSIDSDGTVYIGSSYNMDWGYLHAFGEGTPNNIPTNPEITGPTSGEPGIEYEYTFVSTDADNENVYYRIDWGDYTYTGYDDSYPSGEEVIFTHSWKKEGTYTIKSKTMDEFGEESDWSEHSITIPKSKTFNSPIFRFLNMHPILFLFMRQRLGLNDYGGG